MRAAAHPESTRHGRSAQRRHRPRALRTTGGPPNAWLVRLTCAEMAACLGTWRRSREDTARAMVAPLRQGKLSHEGFDPPAGFAQDTEPFPVWG